MLKKLFLMLNFVLGFSNISYAPPDCSRDCEYACYFICVWGCATCFLSWAMSARENNKYHTTLKAQSATPPVPGTMQNKDKK